jgi:hypothetical protein
MSVYDLCCGLTLLVHREAFWFSVRVIGALLAIGIVMLLVGGVLWTAFRVNGK